MTMRVDFAQFAIPRDATNDELREWINELYRMWADTSDLLAEYQEGDYVKVVRCRDCVHFTPKGTHKFENGKVNTDYCDYVRGWMLQITPDGFCAWAVKRKEGGDD